VNGEKVVAPAAALWISVIVGLANDGVLVKIRNSSTRNAFDLRLEQSRFASHPGD
jgi:hypothetical protein